MSNEVNFSHNQTKNKQKKYSTLNIQFQHFLIILVQNIPPKKHIRGWKGEDGSLSGPPNLKLG